MASLSTMLHGDVDSSAGAGGWAVAQDRQTIIEPGVRSSRSYADWFRDNLELVGDLAALVISLVIYAGLEAGKPHLTFLISSLLYQVWVNST